MSEEFKRWTSKRKSALVLEILQGKTTAAKASREYDISISEIETWVSDAQAGMENALRAKPKDIRQQYEDKIKSMNEAYGEAMLEMKALKKLQELIQLEESS